MRKKQTTQHCALALVLLSLVAGSALAQTDSTQEIVVPLSEPGRPATLEVSLLNGSIAVNAYDGGEIIINTTHDPVEGEVERRDGMLRIPNTSIGMTVEERNNHVSVETDWSARASRLVIRVPRQTSLHLQTVNNGDITVEGVQGDHELGNTNGGISATNVSGSLVANTTNGDVKIELVAMEAGKPMSFSTFNGDVDVTLPASAAARLHMNSGQGDIFTDFDLALEPQQVQLNREEGRDGFRVRMERQVVGRINGGDTDFRFKTYNGDIYLRRGQ